MANAQKMVRLEIDFAGDKQLSRALIGMIGELDDLRPTFAEMVDVIYEAEKKQFDSEGRHGSGGWSELKPSTIRQKMKKAPGMPILQERGLMAASMTNRNHPNAVVHMTPKSLGIGTSVTDDRGRTFWRFHQKGTSRMDARPPYDLTEREKHRFTAPLARRLRAHWLAPQSRLGFGREHRYRRR